MKWKEEAIGKLKKFDAMRKAAYNIPQEITRLEIDAQSIRSSKTDQIRCQHGMSRREDALINNLVYRQELQWTLQQTQLWIRCVTGAFGALTPEEKLILTRLYVCSEKGGVEQLCQELGVEHSSIYRKRDAALHKFTLALYGATES